jgi:LL-diaminopimelate aminotransferase
LKKWVDYALENQSIIIYDGAYHAYINEPDIPHSIYEIKGAKKVALEIRSYSKTAGFTGLRCGYTVFPKELMVYTRTGEEIPLLKLWYRRNLNYSNGVSYVVQRAAEALYSRKGRIEIQELIGYYLKMQNSYVRNFPSWDGKFLEVSILLTFGLKRLITSLH